MMFYVHDDAEIVVADVDAEMNERMQHAMVCEMDVVDGYSHDLTMSRSS